MYYLALQYGHKIAKASQPAATHIVKSGMPYQSQLGTVFSLGIKVFARDIVPSIPLPIFMLKPTVRVEGAIC